MKAKNPRVHECDCSNVATRHDASGWMCEWCWSLRDIYHELSPRRPSLDPDQRRWRWRERKRAQAKIAGKASGAKLVAVTIEERLLRTHYGAATAAFMMEPR